MSNGKERIATAGNLCPPALAGRRGAPIRQLTDAVCDVSGAELLQILRSAQNDRPSKAAQASVFEVCGN